MTTKPRPTAFQTIERENFVLKDKVRYLNLIMHYAMSHPFRVMVRYFFHALPARYFPQLEQYTRKWFDIPMKSLQTYERTEYQAQLQHEVSQLKAEQARRLQAHQDKEQAASEQPAKND